MQFSCGPRPVHEKSTMSLNYPSPYQLSSIPADSPSFLLSSLNNTLQATCNTGSQQLYHANNQESSESMRHVCRVCGKHFRASSLLDIHMRVHVGAKPFVCPVCNHRATQKGNLKLHMKKHHGQDLPPNIDIIPDSGIWGNFDKNFVPTDNVITDAKKSLAHSSLLDQEVVDLIKKCQNSIGQSGMGRITESLKDFIEMAQSHSPSVDNCNDKAWNLDTNNSNNNVLNDIPTSKEQLHNAAMQICKRFLQNNIESRLTQQNNGYHVAEEKPNKPESSVKCKICGWETTSPGYLNVHMRKHKEESHVCSVCGRAFKETWYLKNHMRSHINDMTSGPSALLPDSINAIAKSNDYAGKPRQNLPLQGNIKSEDCKDYSVPYMTLYSACEGCGQVFDNKSLDNHSSECGDIKMKPRTLCQLCQAESSSETEVKKNFTQSLELCEPKPDMEMSKQKVPFVAELNPLIGCLTVSKEQKPSRETSPTETQSQKEVLRQEILKSINKREAQQQLSRKISAIVQSNTVKYDDLKASSLSRSHPNLNLISASPDKNLQPYRNPAMQSLAEIGKTLKPQTAMIQRTSVDKFRPADVPLKTIPPDKRTNGLQQGFQCQFCLKWFKYRSVLGIHMRSHTGERPYKCSYCGYAGTQHNCLKLHIQRHHPKEYMATHNNLVLQNKIHMQSSASKSINSRDEVLLSEQAAKFSPAHCPICGRVSPSPGYLKIHMRSHKKTLDHVCHICGRGFKEYWYLSTHLRTHNRDAPGMQSMSSLPMQHNSIPASIPFSGSFKSSVSKSNSIAAPSSVVRQENMLLSQHSALKPSSSWSPLSAQADEVQQQRNNSPIQINGNFSEVQHATATTVLSTPAFVSKRKAFMPSKWRAKPYHAPSEGDDNMSRRKSKPRKISHGSYLNPVFKRLSPLPMNNGENEQEADFDDMTTDTSLQNEGDMPLDLSVATATTVPCQEFEKAWPEEQNDEEPLNLTLK